MRRTLLLLAVGAILPFLAGILSSRLGLVSLSATAEPMRLEAAVAGPAVHASLGRQAATLHNPLPTRDEELLAGLKLYRNDCPGCHGERGRPSHWGSHNFYPRAPQFADAPPTLTPSEAFVAIKYGIRYSGMGAWEAEMPDEDIWRLAMFVARIGSLPPSVSAAWTAS